jgi:Family of unknown function (DUF5317)
MGRSLLILAALAAAVVLVRPRGPRQTDGLQGWSWLAVGLALQVLWVRVLSLHAALLVPLRWLPSLALLPALRFLWLNRRYRGLWVLALGASLNLLVMAANGGLMPIAPRALHALGGPHKQAGAAVGLSKDRLLGDGEARLAFLDDRLVWGIAELHVASSPGDLLVAMGCLLTLGEELWRSARASLRLRTDRRLELEGPQGATVKGG